jgi:PPM family protein phosphatase
MGDSVRSGIVARMGLAAVEELFGEVWAAYSTAERSVSEATDRLRLGVDQAHGRLYVPWRSRADRNGTTFAGVVVCGDSLSIAHVGDSRVYLLRRSKGRLACITVDHTVLGDAICRGIPQRAAAALPNAHTLTRTIGKASGMELELSVKRWEQGDVVLLCTDGVSDHLETPELTDILLDMDGIGDAASRIVARAIEVGGQDNATALLIRRLR